jgi:indolepyruvate ferredoxin oxidoreductase beta subunit
MKKDIILAGVGGQGILSIAAIIATAAAKAGMFIKQAEVHGMSQRGGDVQSNLRISDQKIYSDLIPAGKADMIIAIEPMESLRYLPMLGKDGWLITNSNPHINIPNYPNLEKILDEVRKVPNHVIIDADHMAAALGSSKFANMVILGAASSHVGFSYEELTDAIKVIFSKKSQEIVESNIRALEMGRNFARDNIT